MRLERVAVIGAGNGGLAAAGDLALRGLAVALFEHPAFAETIRPLQERGAIGVSTLPSTGLAGGFARPASVTTDIRAALEGAAIALVIVPAFAHATLAREMAPHCAPGQVIVLMPGGFGGAMLFRRALLAGGAPPDILVGESSTLPYACRKLDATSVWIRGRKERFDVAGTPAAVTDRVVEAVRGVYAAVRPAANVLETGLTNLNPFIHPPTMLLNVGSMERGDRLLFYHEGVTPSVQRLVDALDRERITLGQAFGLSLPPVPEVLLEHYRHQGARGSSYREVAGGNPVYRWSEMPSGVESRYLTEDIPMSLMPIAALAEQVGAPARTMRATIAFTEGVLGRELAGEARTLTELGLDGLTPVEILARV